MPIGHGEGSYFADGATLEQLERQGRGVFRYCTPEGEQTSGADPNGSLNDIGGTVNERGTVLGRVPPPGRGSAGRLGASTASRTGPRYGPKTATTRELASVSRRARRTNARDLPRTSPRR